MLFACWISIFCDLITNTIFPFFFLTPTWTHAQCHSMSQMKSIFKYLVPQILAKVQVINNIFEWTTGLQDLLGYSYMWKTKNLVRIKSKWNMNLTQETRNFTPSNLKLLLSRSHLLLLCSNTVQLYPYGRWIWIWKKIQKIFFGNLGVIYICIGNSLFIVI